jgi:hypothetical protein
MPRGLHPSLALYHLLVLPPVAFLPHRVEKLRYMHRKTGAARVGDFSGAMALERLSFLSGGQSRDGARE